MQNTPSKDRFALYKDMAKLAEEYGQKRGQEWEAAHLSLVAEVHREYQDHINKTLEGLGKKLSESDNGWDFQRQRGTEPIADKAEGECQKLQRRSQDYREGRSKFDKKVEDYKPKFPDINDEFINKAKGAAKKKRTGFCWSACCCSVSWWKRGSMSVCWRPR